MFWCTTSKQLYIKIREIYILIAVGMEKTERGRNGLGVNQMYHLKSCTHLKLHEVLDWRNILIRFEVFSRTVKSLYKAVK